RLAERIKGKAEAIIVEDEEIARSLSKLGIESIVSYGDKVFRSARSKLLEYAKTIGFTKSDEEYYKWLFNMEVEYTRRKLRRAAAKRDLLAIQTIRSIDDIDKIINMLITRVREWYSVHFPELNELVKEHEDYVRIVSELGVRDNITLDNLLKLGFSEAKASKIAEAAKYSIGSDFSESDIEAVSTLSRIIRDLYELRGSLSRYLEDVMDEVAPNITTLVGPLLGARLLSLAGSLEDMAKLPASTIQVLGAEKALFRALRTG
ncbi:MAG: C/D box methylation guide ribonucleoprotein complex aNOP56 subunit, partial [Acidilobaceae archaeon]